MVSMETWGRMARKKRRGVVEGITGYQVELTACSLITRVSTL